MAFKTVATSAAHVCGSSGTQALPKKTKIAAVKKPASKSTHPSTGEMVNTAIAALKDKKGSSLKAIKKYIAGRYKVDVDKQAIFVKKYLKSAIVKKIIVQTKGTGASGSFKLAVKTEAKTNKTTKKPDAKNHTSPKRSVVRKVKAVAEAKSKKATKKPATKKHTSSRKHVAKEDKAVANPKKRAAKKSAAAKKPVAAKKSTVSDKTPAKSKVDKHSTAPAKSKAPKTKKAKRKAKAAPKK